MLCASSPCAREDEARGRGGEGRAQVVGAVQPLASRGARGEGRLLSHSSASHAKGRLRAGRMERRGRARSGGVGRPKRLRSPPLPTAPPPQGGAASCVRVRVLVLSPATPQYEQISPLHLLATHDAASMRCAGLPRAPAAPRSAPGLCGGDLPRRRRCRRRAGDGRRLVALIVAAQHNHNCPSGHHGQCPARQPHTRRQPALTVHLKGEMCRAPLCARPQ